MTTKTVDMPNMEPTMGPAIQVWLSGGAGWFDSVMGPAVDVDFGVVNAVTFATAEAANADSAER
jgi:hypothetical protein